MIEEEYSEDQSEEDQESGYCWRCSGSGEGMYDGSSCTVCRGSGELPVRRYR